MVPFLFILFGAYFCFHFLGSQPPPPVAHSVDKAIWDESGDWSPPPPGVKRQAPLCAQLGLALP